MRGESDEGAVGINFPTVYDAVTTNNITASNADENVISLLEALNGQFEMLKSEGCPQNKMNIVEAVIYCELQRVRLSGKSLRTKINEHMLSAIKGELPEFVCGVLSAYPHLITDISKRHRGEQIYWS